jgi:membrane-associated phospholipid phosphatase
MRKAHLHLPPSKIDLVVAHAIAKRATPTLERSVKPLTYLADERLVLAAALIFWLTCRRTRKGSPERRVSNQIVLGAAASIALPHLIKRFIDRERPDRKVVHGFRHGIPRSGNANDSFPSGHALQVGALAAASYRMMKLPSRRFVWPAALILAATRLVLLAHYVSDVLAGLALGIAVDTAVSIARQVRPSRRVDATASVRLRGNRLDRPL